MKNFKLLNNVIGWVVFAIALITYTLTLEPTTSWWDCGEYIATAYKLQVGHPPGAPLFQMLGRFFSLFAFGDVSKVAWTINFMSGLSSALTILFLFWSISMLARKLFEREGHTLTQGETLAVLGSAIVGSLAYTFTDTFWFSAVEGEVYAMSSFFTAIVFWAILKWERDADQAHSIRWIVLIAYLIGLSVGVHLLNLLAIPAISFVYYFKKYPKTTLKGIMVTGLISVFLLALIMNFIIPQTVNLAAKLELSFVNGLGLPFNSGTIFYFLLLVTAIVGGLIWTHRKGKLIANTAVLSLGFILIGYTSFLMLVIRANTNTPINENAPKDAISLLSYLNREQYGNWPKLHGQYYSAPFNEQNPYKKGSTIYVRDNAQKRYVKTGETIEYNYDPRFTTIFPRMWSSSPDHIRGYKSWGGEPKETIMANDGDGQLAPVQKPSFGQNLKYMFSYQINHMYLRYFMWNFAGRQNETQGHGGIKYGNWLSGINFLDEIRLGNQQDLPLTMQSKARNTYFFLPLILGLIGMFFHFNRNYKDALIVFLLFFMTGLAIVLYLNQQPFQPRERDYAYAASFYAFAIWIGLGVAAIYNFLVKRKVNPKTAAIGATVVSLVVPGILLAENWNDHDRSGKTAALEFARNYLESCDPNAILIANGDNDTFPLWYAQEVEGIRTDIRVVNYMLASSDWYNHQIQRKVYDAPPVNMTLTPAQYNKGINEQLPIFDRNVGRVTVQDLIGFIASEKEGSKVQLSNNNTVSFLPTRQIRIPVDTVAARKNGFVPKDYTGPVLPYIDLDIKKSYVLKNDLMLLDMLASNKWDRPLYFTSPGIVSDFIDLSQYSHLTGNSFKFMPIPATGHVEGLGGIDTDVALKNLLGFNWGRLNQPDVYVDATSMYIAGMPKQFYIRLAQVLIAKDRKEDAVRVLDKMIEEFPNEKFPFDRSTFMTGEFYYQAGAIEKGNAFNKTLANNFKEELNYYQSLKPGFMNYYQEEQMLAYQLIMAVYQSARDANQTATANEIKTGFFIPEELKSMFE